MGGSTTLNSDPILGALPIIDGYRVLAPCVIYGRIGRGGMGVVFRARHVNLDIDVALKCLKNDLIVHDEIFVQRFKREGRAAAAINHANLIRVYDVTVRKGLHHMIMELVDGETVEDRVAREGPLPFDQAFTIIHAAASGLSAAHEHGIVHRDVKPANLLVSSAGVVKVADLGLAKVSYDIGNGTLDRSVVGTPAYMPPEQWRAAHEVGPSGDVYSLGATLFYLLTGEPPFSGRDLTSLYRQVCVDGFPDIRRLREDLPDEIFEIVNRSTSKEPTYRYRDAGEFVKAVRELTETREDVRLISLMPPPTRTNTQETVHLPPSAEAIARIREMIEESITVLDGEPPVARPSPSGRNRLLVRWGAGAVAFCLVVLLLAFFAGAYEDHPAHAAAGAREAVSQSAAAPLPSPENPVPSAKTARVESATKTIPAAGNVGDAVSIARGLAVRTPRDREVFDKVPVLVDGVVEWPEVNEVRVNGVRIDCVDGRFAGVVSPADAEFSGEFEITVELVSPRGEAISGKRSVLIDQAAPLFEVTNVASGDSVQTSFVLEGSVDDLTPVSILSGSSKADVSEGTWRLPLTLKAGPQKIVLTATDSVGLSTEATLEVLVDGVAPTLEVTAPEDGVRFAQTDVQVTGRASDESGVIAALRVGDRTVEVDAEGRFEVSLPLAEEGENTIEVTVTDRAQNTTSAVLVLERDTMAPIVQVESPTPEDALNTEEPVVFRGTVDDANEVELLVGGEAVEISQGQWEYSAQLPVGEHQVPIEATDALGNRAEVVSLEVNVESHIPKSSRMQFLGNNAQGLQEYRHGPTGIVFVLLDQENMVFQQGSPREESGHESDESPVHEVRLAPFLIAKYEVSQEQWSRVIETNPSEFVGEDLPVENVSWVDCFEFCKRAGLALPTEAEWEYACRAGTTTPFSFGKVLSTDDANYNGRYPYTGGNRGEFRRRTVPVSALSPNEFGLHNLHGNVWEWCATAYSREAYELAAAETRPHSARTGSESSALAGDLKRVLRGGSWKSDADICRSANRYRASPVEPQRRVGLRPVYRLGDQR